MDGQSVTQEETLAMFNKFTSFMDYIRNQLVNNTQLAQEVAALQDQVNSLSARVGEVVNQNVALQEAVNVITQERDHERETNRQLQAHTNDLQERFNQRDNDANHWYAQYQMVNAELEKVKAERDELETEHLKLIEEHDKAKVKLEQIQKVFGPIVEEIHKPEGPQPRDPVTQQWRSWDSESNQWVDKKEATG